jgi:hypothetical protein
MNDIRSVRLLEDWKEHKEGDVIGVHRHVASTLVQKKIGMRSLEDPKSKAKKRSTKSSGLFKTIN